MGNMKGGDSTSSTFLSGDRTPTADEGKDGDVYLNTLTKEMYVKVNGVWVLQGYLNGVPGEGGHGSLHQGQAPAALRRPEAAGGHCPGSGHGPGGTALR